MNKAVFPVESILLTALQVNLLRTISLLRDYSFRLQRNRETKIYEKDLSLTPIFTRRSSSRIRTARLLLPAYLIMVSNPVPRVCLLPLPWSAPGEGKTSGLGTRLSCTGMGLNTHVKQHGGSLKYGFLFKTHACACYYYIRSMRRETVTHRLDLVKPNLNGRMVNRHYQQRILRPKMRRADSVVS